MFVAKLGFPFSDFGLQIICFKALGAPLCSLLGRHVVFMLALGVGWGGANWEEPIFLRFAWRLQDGPYDLGKVLQKQALFEVFGRKLVDLFF